MQRIERIPKKPWQVWIHYVPGLGIAYRVQEHTHGSVRFSDEAAAYCGGEAERDEDGYIVRCYEEVSQVDVARHIARLSEMGIEPDTPLAEVARRIARLAEIIDPNTPLADVERHLARLSEVRIDPDTPPSSLAP